MNSDKEINIDYTRIPQHIAIIMDGNGRWAQEQGQPRGIGHAEGVVSVRKIVEECVEIGVKYLTLYTFSTENWNRPKEEVDLLMQLFVKFVRSELPDLQRQSIRLNMIGDRQRLPQICQDELRYAMKETEKNDKLILTLALSYSSRWEILDAVKKIANERITAENIDESCFASHLSTQGIPDPDLLIRTGGEKRISNFLLWQLSYSELYFTDVYWPAFRKEQLLEAIQNYQMRERRFGKTSEQIKQV